MTKATLSAPQVDHFDAAQDFEDAVDRVRLVKHFERALRAGRRRKANTPRRQIVDLGDAVGVSMPCFSPEDDLYIVKSGIVALASRSDGTPTVNAHVTAYSATTGKLLGHFDGDAVTRLKCFALSAVVLKLCASPGCHDAVIIGTGAQAWEQFRAMDQACSIRKYRIVGRNLDRIDLFVQRMRRETRSQVCGVTMDALPDALVGAAIIATATRANTPLNAFDQLAPAAHINCMGGHTSENREVPLDRLRMSLLISEDRAQAEQEAGAVHKAAVEVEDLFSISDAASLPTIFSSTGNAYHDLLVVSFLLSNAEGAGVL